MESVGIEGSFMGVWVRWMRVRMYVWECGQWAMEAVGSGGSFMGAWVQMDVGVGSGRLSLWKVE